ncbi:MAG: GNAT family N-acetyltransferase [Methanomassiliicoccus sp.]|nr:GNAT family N-acetyltransferase [Methanomassiliicoccus sp.]
MISRATAEDLPAILRLQRQAFRGEAERVGDMNIKPMAQTLDELREEFEGSVFLKYVQDGEILGSVRGRMEGEVCHIGRLVVRPDRWRQGIGRELIDGIERTFAQAARFELFTRIDHERTRPFYRSLGYEPYRSERYSDTLTFVHLFKPGHGPAVGGSRDELKG